MDNRKNCREEIRLIEIKEMEESLRKATRNLIISIASLLISLTALTLRLISIMK